MSEPQVIERYWSSVVIHQGDCTAVMPTLPADSVDAVVTDPPYGLGFMGKEWDTIGDTGRGSRARKERANEVTPEGIGHTSSKGPYLAAGVDSLRSAGLPFQAWSEAWAREAYRVLKPGGHLVAFGGTRTFHRLTCAIEDAGFEIRDCLSWLYGSGFPKSLDVSKAIDKAAGAERAVVGVLHGDRYPNGPGGNTFTVGAGPDGSRVGPQPLTAPSTEDAHRWNGWGTALKPAWEPIILARKPLSERSVAANVLAHGTGGINVDGCRIGTGDDLNGGAYSGGKRQRDEYTSTDTADGAVPLSRLNRGIGEYQQPGGRWPANVVLDEEAAAMLDEQSGECASGYAHVLRRAGTTGRGMGYQSSAAGNVLDATYGDAGGASRFFYTAKASSAERSEGLAGRSTHPTVKPLALMSWLVKLVTPPGGTVLDPFLGSGTTAIACLGNGFSCIGIEREPEYVEIAADRVGLLVAADPPGSRDREEP